MRTATIRTSASGIDLSTPYEPAFIDVLKETIPWRGRKWDREQKVWTVSHAHIAEAMQLLHQYFHVVDLRDEHAKEHTHRREYQHQTNSHTILHLQPTAPPELIKSAYHCLAKLYHPDHGGDLATMQKINRAYDELKR